MTKADHMELLTQLQTLAEQVATTMMAGSGNRQPCADYEDECDPQEFVHRIMAVLDHPHHDDSPCEHPVMQAVDAVVYRALNGATAAMRNGE